MIQHTDTSSSMAQTMARARGTIGLLQNRVIYIGVPTGMNRGDAPRTGLPTGDVKSVRCKIARSIITQYHNTEYGLQRWSAIGQVCESGTEAMKRRRMVVGLES